MRIHTEKQHQAPGSEHQAPDKAFPFEEGKQEAGSQERTRLQLRGCQECQKETNFSEQ